MGIAVWGAETALRSKTRGGGDNEGPILSSPLPSGPSGSSRVLLLPHSAPGAGGQGQTYTMASLGQSSEVLYQCASLLRGTAPLKYFTQHSRPTLVARTTEKQAGTDVSVSVWGVPGGVCGCGEGLSVLGLCALMYLWRGVPMCMCVCVPVCVFMRYRAGSVFWGGCVCFRVLLGDL